MAKECPICITMIQDKRKCIDCCFCDQMACRACWERYFLEDSEYPRCMNCGKGFSRQFLASKFTGKFINGALVEHRADLLWQKEQSFMPSTQIKLEMLNNETELRKEIIQLTEQIVRLKEKKQGMLERLHSKTPAPKQQQVFIRKCPAEDCRGYLSTQWKCGLCSRWACSECHELKGLDREGEHTCHPDTLATAKLLTKDSKGCPKCHTMIYKIDGCNQMWCTQCETAFDWVTGKVETQNIHNPHYFEYMRSRGPVPRNPHDIQCGREITHRTMGQLRNLVNQVYEKFLLADIELPDICTIDNDYIRLMEKVVPRLIHNRVVEVRSLQCDPLQKNENLRIRYMKGELSEVQFKVLIQRTEKSCEKRRELLQVMQLMVTCSEDIVYRMVADLRETLSKPISLLAETRYPKVMGLVTELYALTEHCNGLLADIAVTYSSTMVNYFTRELLFTCKQTEKKRKLGDTTSSSSEVVSVEEYEDLPL